jgi:ABC-type Fe3+/spermidine/putrescine transport system ATPase subunit
MNSGVVKQIGTPREVYHDPATNFVADFIETPVFFDGKGKRLTSIEADLVKGPT